MTSPIKSISRLASRPKQPPLYPTRINNQIGQNIELSDPLANRAMIALMNAQAIFGGAAAHWGGPSALAEIFSAIHGFLFAPSPRPWHEEYNFVNDVGHCENCIYATRANYGFDQLNLSSLKGFRSFSSKLTGHGESHLNPEGVLLSNGPLGSAVAQAQGLAMADRLSGMDRTTLLVLSDGAAMEGETREALASIPGFAAKDQVNPFVLVISDNQTKLSGRTADSYSMQPSLQSLQVLGWNVIDLQQAHDLQQVYQALEQALALARANPKQPVCIWAHTIKGYGIAQTVQSASGGHGFPNDMAEKVSGVLAELYQDQAIPAEFMQWAQEIESAFAQRKAQVKAPSAIKKEKIQMGVARALEKLAQEGFPIVSVASDLQGSTGLGAFQKAHPDLSFDVGIAEANMVSVAAGLSKSGYLPIVDTFAQFGVTKGLLPFTMASISQAPIIGVFSHVGFQDAADGASHQATTYLSALASVPNIKLVSLSSSSEAEVLVEAALRYQHAEKSAGRTPDSVVFFLGREDFPSHYPDAGEIAWLKPQLLRQGQDALIVVTGHTAVQALAAADLLLAQNIHVTVLQNAFVNQPDLEVVVDQLRRNNNILLTIEDHQLIGGAGAILSHALLLAGEQFKLKSLGIRGHFGHSAYKASELYDAHGIGVRDLVQAVLSLNTQA